MIICCVLPSAKLLEAVKASIGIITGDARHAKGEDPAVVFVLRAGDGDSLQHERDKNRQ